MRWGESYRKGIDSFHFVLSFHVGEFVFSMKMFVDVFLENSARNYIRASLPVYRGSKRRNIGQEVIRVIAWIEPPTKFPSFTSYGAMYT